MQCAVRWARQRAPLGGAVIWLCHTSSRGRNAAMPHSSRGRNAVCPKPVDGPLGSEDSAAQPENKNGDYLLIKHHVVNKKSLRI